MYSIYKLLKFSLNNRAFSQYFIKLFFKHWFHSNSLQLKDHYSNTSFTSVVSTQQLQIVDSLPYLRLCMSYFTHVNLAPAFSSLLLMVQYAHTEFKFHNTIFKRNDDSFTFQNMKVPKGAFCIVRR